MLNEPTLVTGAILRRGSLRAAIYDRLTRSLGKEPETATPRDIYDALSLAVREELSARWLATQRRVARARVKRLCYLSVEFLPGRSLVNALSSLDSRAHRRGARGGRQHGPRFRSVIALEVDPGLGNGGLGRLAACFLDSLATLQYPATGYGIRYDYGIFTQSIDKDGAQRESASTWLRLHNVWETPRSDARYIVRFGGRVLTTHDVERRAALALGRDAGRSGGGLRPAGARQSQPDGESPAAVVGPRAAAVPHRGFQRRQLFGRRRRPGRREESLARAVSGRLDAAGQGAALQAAVLLRQREHPGHPRARISPRNARSKDLPDALAIQLNDTHPALAIPELMRLLVDQYDMEWAEAWDICREVFGYTNHTLLPEALETWPVQFFERLLPRHLQIIYRINESSCSRSRSAFKGDGAAKTDAVASSTRTHGRRVRMAHLAVVGSHKVNGVAKLHSELMRKTIFSGLRAAVPGSLHQRDERHRRAALAEAVESAAVARC